MNIRKKIKNDNNNNNNNNRKKNIKRGNNTINTTKNRSHLECSSTEISYCGLRHLTVSFIKVLLIRTDTVTYLTSIYKTSERKYSKFQKRKEKKNKHSF